MPSRIRTTVVGVVVDMVLLYVLLEAGITVGTAGTLTLPVAALVMYLLAARVGVGPVAGSGRGRTGWFALAVVLTVFLRGGILAWTERIPGCPTAVVAAVGALAAGGLMWAAMAIEPDRRDDGGGEAVAWRHPVTALLVYAVLLRLVYLGLPELIHEEAYYWNYSRHLDVGYLDHPPMVAWITWVFTALLGHTELGVRAGAFVSWLAGACFVFKLARRIFDSVTGVCALLLFAVLPVYFGVGLFMSPDAALTACWAAVLYYAYQALVDEDPAAWLGVGLFLGAGLLSKYTMVLVGGALAAFLVLDSRARPWLRRASPYVAAGIALLLFSPVIFWNFQHDWASFVFQGPRRAGGSLAFNLPHLLGAVAVLVTPVGLAAVAVAAFSGKQLSPGGTPDRRDRFARGFRLLLSLTLLPFSVFAFYSLFRSTKLNWTAPVWLGMLPFMARMMATPWLSDAGRWRRWLSPRTWRTTAIVLLLIYGAGLHYLVLGLWGLPLPQSQTGLVGLGWKELAAKIETTVERVERDTGQRPLVVGMNRDRISSWLAFYRSQAMARRSGKNTGAAALDTAGPHLFGQVSHMYEFWFPPSPQDHDRPMILVGDRPEQLDVHSAWHRAGPVREISAEKNGQTTWRLYYRILYPVDRAEDGGRDAPPETGQDDGMSSLGPGAGRVLGS